ncbi:DUF4144 domain-containing protein [Pseudoalteromonas sp. SMS1]|uniref:DUF4144 domain-containing protein n=1 Tax=Pseudoalteromonas sp. SMS1 TaxID=2908894 RepID=UPI001F47676D|nr:DUF4144 domain-containing protein [Pseudoalteromonas sp. SMS1]MCF2857312.1 DUF4144 domain-containing protein [Pseudoalteromonas sp. SMS1]
MINSYPLVLIFDQSIEYVDSAKNLEESLFYLSEKQLKTVIYINIHGDVYDRDGHPTHLPNYSDLTKLVQQKLVSEGQCCTAKIQISQLDQLFNLLKETN